MKPQTPEFTEEQREYLLGIWYDCAIQGATAKMLEPLWVAIVADPHSTAAKATAIVQGGNNGERHNECDS